MKEAFTEEDEILDIVDENDEVIGQVHRDKMGEVGSGYFRASELLIINDEGLLWIPRRQPHKRIAPGGLDFSTGGHVSSGDDYEETLRREVKEELNLDLQEDKLQFLNKFSPVPGYPPYFRAVYLYRSNDVPEYNHEDFSGYEWIDPDALLRKLEAGEPAKQNLAHTIEYLIDYLKSNKN